MLLIQETYREYIDINEANGTEARKGNTYLLRLSFSTRLTSNPNMATRKSSS
jgi:hypothetical protein